MIIERWIELPCAAIRLAVFLILHSKEDAFFVVFVLVCRSYCSVNAGTHRRSPLAPFGDVNKVYVAEGNVLLERLLE